MAGTWDRWLWLGGSLLLGIIATQTVWRLERLKNPPAWIAIALGWPYLPIVFAVLRLLFYIGLPFALLFWGRDAVVRSTLGLQPLPGLERVFAGPEAVIDPVAVADNLADWTRDVGWALGLGVAAWAVLASGWWLARRASREKPPDVTSTSSWNLLLEAVLHEVHWAFYRNAPVVALTFSVGTTSGRYWGSWIGLSLVALEAILNPAWWVDLRSQDKAPMTLLRAGMAVLSAVLFLQTQNLWLAVLTHLGVTWGMCLVMPCKSQPARTKAL
jgi:hypothetical protein